MPRDRYRALYDNFRWLVPERFNIAEVCGRRWAAQPARIALHTEDEAGRAATFTYAALMRDANRLSNALAALGVGRGDRVAVVLPQRAETAIAHLGILQQGAVSMPLSCLFGPEALAYRLNDSGARAAICDAAAAASLQSLRGTCPLLKDVVCVDGPVEGARDWHALLSQAADRFAAVDTRRWNGRLPPAEVGGEGKREVR